MNTVREVAIALKLSAYTIRRHIKTGKIKAKKVKVGVTEKQEYRISETELNRLKSLYAK